MRKIYILFLAFFLALGVFGADRNFYLSNTEHPGRDTIIGMSGNEKQDGGLTNSELAKSAAFTLIR